MPDAPLSAHHQKGLTLVELVSVIILLGILSAAALPRFMNASDAAHEGVVNGLIGSLREGMALFHAEYYVAGKPAAGTTLPGFGAGVLQTNAQGYPAGADGGASLGSAADCIAIFQEVLQTSLTISAGVDISPAVPDEADFVNATTDIMTLYYNVASGPFVPEPICVYAYMRQYSSAADGPVPRIDYDGTTGAITRGPDL